jgi:hypothetical protein
MYSERKDFNLYKNISHPKQRFRLPLRYTFIKYFSQQHNNNNKTAL